jgi:uncharacterized protein (DUF1501 family)
MTQKLTRRDFLKFSASTTAAWSLGFPALGMERAGMPHLSIAMDEASARDALICIFLRGGMDGLNAVIPLFDEDYYRQRPMLAIPEAGSGEGAALDLDGFFGLHPALKPMMEIWEDKALAIIHATGSPDPTHSHFDAMDYMERGTPGEKTLPSGWIGRHLKTVGGENETPFRAVGMGGVMAASLRGQVAVTTLQSIADFQLQARVKDLERLQEALASLYEHEPTLEETAEATFDAVKTLATVSNDDYTPANRAAYPDGDFGLGLAQIAQLLKAEVGLEAACLDLGGFDTHVDQAKRLQALLTELGAGLAAFYQDMSDMRMTYTVVTMSEFGRRLEENGNAGTDHGHGGVMLTFGTGVNGGEVFSEWPGLDTEALYGPGDLALTIDYRDVLGELVSKRLGNGENLEAVFPGYEVKEREIFSEVAEASKEPEVAEEAS